jgi:hypothetical protein
MIPGFPYSSGLGASWDFWDVGYQMADDGVLEFEHPQNWMLSRSIQLVRNPTRVDLGVLKPHGFMMCSNMGPSK